MGYRHVMNLKRKLAKEFEEQTGLTPQYRNEWASWLEANGHIQPEVTPDSLNKEELLLQNTVRKTDPTGVKKI